MKRMSVNRWALLLVFAGGCGASNSSGGSVGGGTAIHDPGSGGSGSGTMTTIGGTSSSGTVQTCTGQVAEAPPYYCLASRDSGGFVADARGIAFVASADLVQIRDGSKLAMYPRLILGGMPPGDLSTIYTPDKGTGLGTGALSMDNDSVYYSATGGALVDDSRMGIFSVPRSGGPPTTLYSDHVASGPVTDGTNLYFLGNGASGKQAVLQIAKTGGSATTVSERGYVSLSSIVMSGSDLYWLEQNEPQDTADFAIQKLSIAAGGGGESTLFATIPHALDPVLTLVTGGKAVFTSSTSLLTVDLYTVAAGQAPVRVASQAGVPLVAAPDGTIFYGTEQGLMRASIAFDHPTLVPNTQEISGVAVGPTDLWYADRRCIYKTPL